MSENFGRCPRCKGKGYILVTETNDGVTEDIELDCMRCAGTGKDADAVRYYEREVL